MLRRRFIGIGIVVGAGMACLDPSGMPSTVHDAPTGPIVPLGRAVRPSVSAELHVHGWSNHSGSVFPASIAWQTQQAAQAGVDILWWTDHADIYAYRVRDFVVAPTVPTSIGPRTWTVGTWFSGAGSAFIMSSAGSLTGLTTNGSRMVVTLPPGDTSVADTVLLFFGRLIHGTPRRASFGVLARPLIGNPRFEMMVWRDRTTHHFPGLQLTVPLAWHPGGSLGYREVLRYRFQGPVGAPLLNGDTAEYERAWPDSDSTVVVLTPKGDAAIFPDGLDNTTDEYRVLFAVPRTGAGVSLEFAFPTVTNQDSTAAVQMPPAIATAQAAGNAYGVRVLWGMELGGFDPALTASQWPSVSGAGTHIAVYLPSSVDPAFVEAPHGTNAQLTAALNSIGGVTSIPHPLGTSVAVPTATFEANRPRVDSLGAFLVQHGGWGANLIEVGYPVRGDMGLHEHLYLLDYLLASGVRLCGVGVSDSHGQRMLADPTIPDEQDNLITWIAGVNRASPVTDLLTAMRNCDVSFGSPFFVRGGLWVQVVTDSIGQQRLRIDAGGVSPSATYYAYEVILDSSGIGHEPTYRQLGTVVQPNPLPPVGGCLPSYARVEAWAGTRFLASSNVVRVASDRARCSTPTSRLLPLNEHGSGRALQQSP